MARLIDADELKKVIFPEGTSGGFWGFGQLCEMLDEQPTVDVVSKGVVEQIMWELDMAIQQLNEYGVQLGEKADCARVVRCKDCIHKHEYTEYLLYCFHHGMTKKYDDFCSYGECRDD